MLLTFKELKLKRLNNKKGKLLKRLSSYSDENDPQRTYRTIINLRLEKLQHKIVNAEYAIRKRRK